MLRGYMSLLDIHIVIFLSVCFVGAMLCPDSNERLNGFDLATLGSS